MKTEIGGYNPYPYSHLNEKLLDKSQIFIFSLSMKEKFIPINLDVGVSYESGIMFGYDLLIPATINKYPCRS